MFVTHWVKILLWDQILIHRYYFINYLYFTFFISLPILLYNYRIIAFFNVNFMKTWSKLKSWSRYHMNNWNKNNHLFAEIGASNNPCSETYAGPKAFSEVENQHLRDFILARKGQFKAYLTFHSYGQVNPWLNFNRI